MRRKVESGTGSPNFAAGNDLRIGERKRCKSERISSQKNRRKEGDNLEIRNMGYFISSEGETTRNRKKRQGEGLKQRQEFENLLDAGTPRKKNTEETFNTMKHLVQPVRYDMLICCARLPVTKGKRARPNSLWAVNTRSVKATGRPGKKFIMRCGGKTGLKKPRRASDLGD